MTGRRRDVLTVLLGPPLLGAAAGCIVGTYLAITGHIDDTRAAMMASVSGLAPIGAAVGAVYSMIGIPVAAVAVWWVRRTGNRAGSRTAATVAGTAGPAGVMMVDASSAPVMHAPATWAAATLGAVLIAGALWLLLGWLLPTSPSSASRPMTRGLP